jgi:uncharacterized protein (TIGR03085 family)
MLAIADDVEAERAAIVTSLGGVGPSARTACGDWTAFDLAAHLVSQERLGGVGAFAIRFLGMRGVPVTVNPVAVARFVRRERRHGFEALLDRLRHPLPRLLLQPLVAPVALFEFWTHHDDLAVPNGLAHGVPATLAEAIPWLLRYQARHMPTGVRVTVRSSDDNNCTVDPKSEPGVTVEGSVADLVRWLSGRQPLAEIAMTGPDAKVRALRAFTASV